MSVEILLSGCSKLGVILGVGPDGKLRVSPPGKLSEDLKRELRQHKQELLALLTSPQSAPDYRRFYHQASESAREDCWQIDSLWLLNTYPSLWMQMVSLDETLLH